MAGSAGDLAKRVAVALVGIPIVIGMAYLGGHWLAAFLAAFAAVAAWEFCAMNRSRGVASFPWVASAGALALVLLASSAGLEEFVVWAVLLGLAVGTPVVLLAPQSSKPAVAASVTFFAALYTGGLLAFAVWLRAIGGGTGWRGVGILFLPIAVTWVGDSAAYFVGRAIGRHKLAPAISPNKTWEGAIAGFAATVGFGVLFVDFTRDWVGWELSLWQILALGGIVSIAGQLGDLVESRFKRDCGVKDSSNLIPGHGGFLDRIDSLLFAFPVTYAYLSLVGL